MPSIDLTANGGHVDPKLFISTFILIFLAELLDKTALATVMMATRGSPWPIFLGVAAAFVIQTIVAVIFGSFIGRFPAIWVHLGAKFMFMAFACLAWKRGMEAADEPGVESTRVSNHSFSKTVWSSFVVIFIAEWGDLTQLATASLVARYQGQAMMISLAAVAALWSVTGIAVFLGYKLKGFIRPALLQKVAAVAFAGVGF
jgi:putative Ca2+/H+ antiporter (TMEM165/GDT1 family)